LGFNSIVTFNLFSKSTLRSCGVIPKNFKILLRDPIHISSFVLVMGAIIVYWKEDLYLDGVSIHVCRGSCENRRVLDLYVEHETDKPNLTGVGKGVEEDLIPCLQR
jgi:hypothetical protein